METQTKAEQKDSLRSSFQQQITPFIWFDHQAEEAVNFYISIFNNSALLKTVRYGEEGSEISALEAGTVMTIDFVIEGQKFTALNGGPIFQLNPSISFFVNCSNEKEVNRLWTKLSDGGTVMMELDHYPFSEKYGWIQDRYGVSWQLILQPRDQKIVPCLMFAGDQHKKAEEAINFYTSIFSDSEIIMMEKYKKGEGPKGGVVHSKFNLNGQEFVAMDSHIPMPVNFNPALSMVIRCETQDELDYYWNELSKGGDEKAQQCGWLQDRFGVSWQIVPKILGQLLNDENSVKSGRVMQSMLKMKKIDIQKLQSAFHGK